MFGINFAGNGFLFSLFVFFVSSYGLFEAGFYADFMLGSLLGVIFGIFSGGFIVELKYNPNYQYLKSQDQVET